jgi:hypothetical protein
MTDLDFSMLDESLGGEDKADNTIPIVQLEEGQIDPRYTRSSYSTSLLLHACPRKFQLKCLEAEKQDDLSTSITFAFGHAVGLGIAELFTNRNLTQTIFKMFAGWECDFFAENEKQKKSLAHAINAIQMLESMLEDGFMNEYIVAEFGGKPAAELGFRIKFPGRYATHTYRGYIDLVLQHIISGEFGVLENKTNSGTWVNHLQYKNSSQAVGYGVILDQLERNKSSYVVQYLVFMSKLNKYADFEFPKSYHSRALWLRDRLWDIQLVEMLFMQEGNYGIWPQHGESCTSFGRACEYMDVCGLDTRNLMSPLRENQLVERDRRTGEIVEYDFELTLEDLL